MAWMAWGRRSRNDRGWTRGGLALGATLLCPGPTGRRRARVWSFTRSAVLEGEILPLRRHLPACLIIMVLLAFSGQRPRVPLNVLQLAGRPQDTEASGLKRRQGRRPGNPG